MKKTFLLMLYPALAVLIALPLLALALVMNVGIRQFGIDLSELQLTETARIGAVAVKQAILTGQDLPATCRALAEGSSVRLTIIQSDGTVSFDSLADPATMENHLNREEVQEALRSGSGHAFRPSATIKEDSAYSAVRLDLPGRPGFPWIIRVSLALPQIGSMLAANGLQVALAAGFILAAALAAAWFIARRLRQPVTRLQATAQRWASGQLAARAMIDSPWELARLAEAMNAMAGDLQLRLASLEQAREETLAVLNSMAEAVIVTGGGGRVIALNPRAALLFGVSDSASAADGRHDLLEITRATSLAELEERARSGTLADATIEWIGSERRTLQVTAAPLAKQGGAVMVLNDITRLMKLETIRKDFVANVSHELKTPIQSIKGFVETLESGAVDNPDDARRFLGIIRRNSERLEAIIDDLLSLARLEGMAEHGAIPREPVPVDRVVRAVLDTLSEAASRKSMDIKVESSLPAGSADIVSGSEGLLEQLLLNLVDNAIKYCPEGSSILIAHGPNTRDGSWELSVSDNGPGIPARELDRIFERFYRVEKSRSRDSGGTGLGLAIVRHIALLHGGSVSVQSPAGQGASFVVRLPPARPAG